MTNIDRARNLLNRLLVKEVKEGNLTMDADRGLERRLAQGLADATPPLLMPDPPEPTRWKQNEEPEWDACYTTVTPAGYEGRVIVEDSDEKWEASAEDIRALALAMLAAASYAEGNQA